MLRFIKNCDCLAGSLVFLVHAMTANNLNYTQNTVDESIAF